MSWKSEEREKSIEAHNYHMRQIELKKVEILKNIFQKLNDKSLKPNNKILKDIKKEILTLF